jgi:rare lipoprotein A
MMKKTSHSLLLFWLGTLSLLLVLPLALPAQQRERGQASYYADKYHATAKTANGELYDKYDFTAAHRDLPFNTWVQVTNLDNGRSVKVRINDRGPFKPGRIIDVSRIAAEAIGLIQAGVAPVEIEVISSPTSVQDPAPLPDRPRPDKPPRDLSDLPVVDEYGRSLGQPEPEAPEMPPAEVEPEVPPTPEALVGAEKYTPALFRMVAYKEDMMGYGVQIGAYFNVYRLFEAMHELSAEGYQNTLVQNSLKDGKPLFRILIGPYPSRGDAERVRKSLKKKGKNGIILDLNGLR